MICMHESIDNSWIYVANSYLRAISASAAAFNLSNMSIRCWRNSGAGVTCLPDVLVVLFYSEKKGTFQCILAMEVCIYLERIRAGIGILGLGSLGSLGLLLNLGLCIGRS